MTTAGRPAHPRVDAPAVYALFALSGASALIYQVIWTRWLGLVFGNTTLSISVVLGCFMLGLGLGSRLAGARLRRLRDPMRWYALAELGIGLYALACRPLIELTDRVFTALVSVDSPAGYSLIVRTGLSAALLLIPTLLMGTTLPLLSDFFRRGRSDARSWRVGLLYAANTAGAAAGILLAGFLLIELVGVFGTTLVAAAMNFLVARLGYRLSRSAGAAERTAPAAPDEKRGALGTYALWAVAWSGALALASEVLWTRTLETIVGNSTYAFSSIVVVYLCGIALGSWAMSRTVRRLKALPLWFAGLLLAMGLWTLAAIGLFGIIAASLAQFSLQAVPLGVIFRHSLEATSVLFPLALLSGACFPVATRLVEPEASDASGARVADVYAWNTFGAVAGSAIGGFMLAPLWDFTNALYMLACLYGAGAAAACAYLALRRARRGERLAAAALGAAALAAALFALERARDAGRYARSFEARHPEWEATFHRPGLQGVTSVVRAKAGARSAVLLVNGIGMTALATDAKMMAHLPMLLHPKPDDALVICLGMGTTYRSALSYGGRVTAVELVEEVVDALGRFQAPELLNAPRGRIVVNDGRGFLKLSRETFDVITIDPPPPIDAAGVSSLYSKEFIELARAHLKKGGIMAHWVPYPQARAGVSDKATMMMLTATFASAFPYVYYHAAFLPIGLHLVGSMEPIDFAPASLSRRLSNPAVSADINEWDRLPPDFFSSGWIRVPPGDLRIPLDTDDRPRLEFFLLKALAAGGERFHPVNNW